MTEAEYAGDGFSILNAAGHYHVYESAQREESDLDYLVLLGLRSAWMQAPRQVDGHGFSDKTRTGIKLQDSLPARGCVACLLDQFAFGSRQFAFAGIDAPSAELPEILLSGVSILADEQHARLGMSFVDRKNYYRSGMAHNVAAAAHAPWFQHLVGGDPESRPTVDFDGRKQAGFGFGMG